MITEQSEGELRSAGNSKGFGIPKMQCIFKENGVN